MKSRILTAFAVAGLATALSAVAGAQTPTLYVRIGPVNPPARTATANSSDIPIMQIEVTAAGANITVNWIDFYFAGSGAYAAVTTPRLWSDDNNDGFADSYFDAEFNAWPMNKNVAQSSFEFPNHAKQLTTVLAGTTERWLLTYTIGAATPGQTFGAILHNDIGKKESINATYLGMAGPVPASVVLEPGVIALSSNAVTIAPPSPSVVEPVPGGIAENQFVMISPSITPTGTGFDQITAQLGPAGSGGSWRLFRYDGTTGRYDEYGEAGFPYATLDPRYGWWFISRRGGKMVFQGTSTQGTASFGLPLPAVGWVQIGNPYNAVMPLSFIDVQQAAGPAPLNAAGNTRTSTVVYRYADGGYVAETVAMQPGTGYWVYVITGTTLTFNRPPNAMKPGIELSQERPLYAGEASPPPPPSIGSGEGGSGGGGGCFAASAGGLAGLTLALGVGVAGLAAVLRRRSR